MTVKVGDKFRSTYADANALWTVKSKAGRGMWRCVIEDDEDYAGAVQGFTTIQIESRAAFDRRFENFMDEHDRFVESVPTGGIIHYDNGFGNYVRMVKQADGERGERFIPVALVGSWREHDLPRRQLDGSIYPGYYAEKIRDGVRMEPNVSCYYEAAPERFARKGDPRGMTPIDLTVPPMTADERALAMYVEQLNRIGAVCSDTPRTLDEARAAYDRVRALAVPARLIPNIAE